MNIKLKNIPKFQTGVKFSSTNANGKNWREQIFNYYRQHILDQLSPENDDYGYWLNDMQSRHAKLYSDANKSGNWQNIAYQNDLVGQYQHDYKGDKRFGTYSPGNNYKTDFNQLGIVKAQEQNRYDISGPKRTSGDYGNHDFKVDNLYSAITDDRRLLGRKGDWDETSEDYKQWQKDLNARGWETFLDNDGYYKLRRLGDPLKRLGITGHIEGLNLPINISKKEDGSRVPVGTKDGKYGFDWSKIQSVASKILNNPNLYAAGRLAGNLLANERIYDEYIKGIRPNLLQTYQTHRQVLGDEATKQAYYRRAAQGQTKAAQPFTSDADRQVAYMNEAKRVGDELRAQGDLADNQEIRRTSDESNQHQWANTQRATEVANTNLASLNKAIADKHSILAQKHAAQWSSIDNFLLGLETRNNQKIVERKAIQNQIDALEQYDWLNNNKNYQDALKAYNDYVAKNGDNFSTDIKLQELYKAVVNAKRNALKGWLNQRLISAKEGAKITYKKKDDLLYKTAKDTVDHFREMSKLLKRKRKDKQEIVKLAPHPKGSTRRYQQGGVAPFTVYKPAPLGGETTISSQGSTSSTKADKVDPKKESLDMIKKLFESVSAHGIPIDASLIYKDMNNFLAKSRLFGDELSTDDIASMYVNMMYKVNNLKFSGELYKEARKRAADNEALNEYAVDSYGNVIVQDKENKGIKSIDLSEFQENRDKYTPLTNNMLLQMRAYNPEMAFRNGDVFMDTVVANGVGITKISEYIKNLIGTLGTNEEKIEGLSKIESGKVKEGIKIIDNLINAAPDGVYKLSQLDKNQKSQVEAAFRYVMGSLPIQQKAILQLHASEVGMDLKDLLLNRLTSNTGYTHNIEIDPLTGRVSKKKEGDSEDKSSIKSNFLDQVQRDQIGIDREFSLVTKDGITKLYSLNSKYISQLPNVTEDMSLEKMLGESKIGSIMDSRLGVTFGDQVVSPNNFKDIMFDLGGGATIVTLPCKYENGHKVVNFAIKDEYDNAIKEVSKVIPIDYNNPEFIKALSNKLHEKGLDSLLKGDILDPNMLGHFLVVSAYTTDKIKFNTNSKYIEKVRNPDKDLEERLIRGLSTNDKKNDYEIDVDDKFGWFEGTWDDIYRGNVFIPLSNDPVSAQTGWGSGDNIKLEDAKKLAEQNQDFQKILKQKSSSSNIL